MALDLVPSIRSPSQCPGTARSLASAGRSLMWTMPAQLALAVRHRQPARPAPGPAAAQVAGQLLAQRPAGLHEQRQVDRLVRHPHLRVVGIARRQPTRDLLRRPAQLQLALHHLRSRGHRPASPASDDAPPQRPPVSGDSPIPASPAVGRHLPTHRRRCRPSPLAIPRSDPPAASPREISSRSASDNRNGDRFGSRLAGRCNAITARRIAYRDRLSPDATATPAHPRPAARRSVASLRPRSDPYSHLRPRSNRIRTGCCVDPLRPSRIGCVRSRAIRPVSAVRSPITWTSTRPTANPQTGHQLAVGSECHPSTLPWAHA